MADGTAYTDGTAIQLLVEQTGQTDSFTEDTRSHKQHANIKQHRVSLSTTVGSNVSAVGCKE